MKSTKAKTLIGRVATVNFVEAEVYNLPMKVDTGAYRSSIWATRIKEAGDVLSFRLLGPHSEFYSGREVTTTEFEVVEVENSFGHREKRYSVFLKVEVGGRLIKSNFTLSNRSTKIYPGLIGRKMLKNRFVVDVGLGKSLDDEEKYGDNSLK